MEVGLPPPLGRDQSLFSYLDPAYNGQHTRSKVAWNRGQSLSTATDFPSLSSRPINDYDSDAGSDVYGASILSQAPPSPTSSLVRPVPPFNLHAQHGMQAAAQQHLAHSASNLAPLPCIGAVSLPERDVGQLTVVPPAGSLSESQSRYSMDRSSSARFRTDLMVAKTGANAMDRYKALTRLFSGVKRELAACGMAQPMRPSSWSSSSHHDLLCRIVEIGEALSGFGTADFGERSNSSRAINTKDYAYLLKLYGETFWSLFKQEFIDAMPYPMQDEMWSVRGLLTVRFEANAIIHDQLIKHVGLEQTGAQGAVVYNTSVVTANPVTTVSSKPNNAVNAYAAAAAKAVQSSHNKLGLIALASAAGLFLVKQTGLLGFVPGLGRFRRRRSESHNDPSSEDVPVRGRRRDRTQRINPDERLLLAFDHVDRTFKELSKAQHNVELLKNDWRLGPLRLSAPFEGPDPPGFEPVELRSCEPRHFMHAQLGHP